VDIYEKLRPGASERQLVRVGRLATGVVVVLGMLWIPVMRHVSGALYVYLQSVQAYLGPPITAVFFLGVFSTRINGTGAVTGLIVGFVLGMVKLAAQILAGIESVSVNLPGFIVSFGRFNFLYFCIILFAVSVTTVVTVSLFTPKPSAEKLAGLTFATTPRDERRTWTKWDVTHTVIILAIIAAVYIYFTG